MSVDAGGRRAARELLEAAGRLGPPPDLDRLRRRGRRRAAARAGLAVAAVAVTVALAGQALPGLERPGPAPAPPAGAAGPRAWPGVAGLDGHVRDAVATGEAEQAEVAAGPSGVWVLNRRPGRPDELVRVDPDSDRVVARIDVGQRAAGLAVGPDGLVWLTRAGPRADRPELLMVNPNDDSVAVTVPLPGADLRSGTGATLVAWNAVWVADGSGALLRLALPIDRVERVRAVAGAGYPADAGGWLWVTSGPSLLRIDPVDGDVTGRATGAPLRAAAPATALATGHGSLWLAGTGGGSPRLLRLDRGEGRIEAMVRLGAAGGSRRPALAVGERVVAVRAGQDLLLVDPATDSVRVRVPLGDDRGGVAAHAGTVWATDPVRGRLLRIDPGF